MGARAERKAKMKQLRDDIIAICEEIFEGMFVAGKRVVDIHKKRWIAKKSDKVQDIDTKEKGHVIGLYDDLEGNTGLSIEVSMPDQNIFYVQRNVGQYQRRIQNLRIEGRDINAAELFVRCYEAIIPKLKKEKQWDEGGIKQMVNITIQEYVDSIWDKAKVRGLLKKGHTDSADTYERARRLLNVR